MMHIIILSVFALIAFILYKAMKSGKQQAQEPVEQQPQPTQFDLLNDNGDPIKPPRPATSKTVGNHNAPVKRLKYFCIKDKGYHVSVWPKDYVQFDIVEFPIAGMKHRQNIHNYLGEFIGTLEQEPTNPHDPNAIKILAPDGHHVGYVPRDMTAEVRSNATLPCPCFCYIGICDNTYFSDCYIPRK